MGCRCVIPIAVIKNLKSTAVAVALALAPLALAAPAQATPPQASVSVAPTTLTHSQAASRLRAAKISWKSSGNCSNRNNKRCTSFDGIRVRSIQGISALKRSSGCPITITGGTEVGHAAGAKSHAKGYKLDIVPGACVTRFIEHNAKRSYKRSDNAWVWKGTVRGVQADFARESNHWDITFN